MDIRRATTPDEIHAAADLLDGPPLESATERFLADERHHLLVAVDEETTVGFVSGVETTHPDKGTEMFLYELAVAASHRGRGIGRELIRALAELASERGCYGMWVATDEGNLAARAAYAGAGGVPEEHQVVYVWNFAGNS
jgi:ribosomal protein S18 acetylase RimI-like enzyme